MSVDDRLEILELPARYSHAWDAADADAYAALFTDDASFELLRAGSDEPALRLEGREAIHAWAAERHAARPAGEQPRAHAGGTIIEELSGDAARGRTMLLQTIMGAAATSPGLPSAVSTARSGAGRRTAGASRAGDCGSTFRSPPPACRRSPECVLAHVVRTRVQARRTARGAAMETPIEAKAGEDLWFVQEGPPTGRLIRLSLSWEEVLGFRVGELLGTSKLSLIHEDDAATCVAWAERLLAGDRVGSYRARVRCRDGSFAVCDWNGIAVPEKQLIFGIAHLVDEHVERDPEVVVHDSGLALDRAARIARVGDVELPLTRSEFDLLLVLLESQGSVLTADTIAREVWAYSEAGARNFLQAHVSRLRKKLRRLGVSSLIETRRGVGYVIR